MSHKNPHPLWTVFGTLIALAALVWAIFVWVVPHDNNQNPNLPPPEQNTVVSIVSAQNSISTAVASTETAQENAAAQVNATATATATAAANDQANQIAVGCIVGVLLIILLILVIAALAAFI